LGVTELNINSEQRSYVARIKLIVDARCVERANQKLRQLGLLTTDGSPVSPDQVGLAWRRFLDFPQSSGRADEWEWAIVLLTFVDLAEQFGQQLEASFDRARLRYEKSVLEISLRAGSKCYGVGRGEFVYGSGDQTLLGIAFALLENVLRQRNALSQAQLRMALGMRGVGRLLLCRGRETIREIEDSFDDILESFDMGNNGQESLEYLRECTVRRLELGFDQDALEWLRNLLDRTSVSDRQFLSDVLKYHQFASKSLQTGDPEIAEHVEAAISACTKALTLPDPGNRCPDAILRCFRGHMLSNRWSYLGTYEPEAMLADIDAALPDLRFAAEHGLGGADLTLALLRRSGIVERTDGNRSRGDIDEAEANVGLATPEVASRLSLQIAEARLQLSLKEALTSEDAPTQLRLCEQLLSLETTLSRSVFLVLLSLKQLWEGHEVDPERLAAVCRKAVLNTRECFHRGELADDHGARCLSHAAGLAKRLDGERPTVETYQLHILAIDALEASSAPLLGQTADLALKLAKRQQGAGEQESSADYYRDAIDLYGRAFAAADQTSEDLTDMFLPRVCHSKLGEAYIRAGRSVAGIDAYQRAIEHLETSFALGNDAPELFGLLGDAFYREGTATGDNAMLRQALKYKQRAQQAGHEARESFSVVSRIFGRIYDRTGDPDDLASAIQSAAKAAQIDGDWPWPWFQLAGFSTVPAEQLGAAIARINGGADPAVNLVAQRERQELLDTAVLAAARNTEFTKEVLGGRSKVYALDDPHQLLSNAMVLKRAWRENAMREISAAGNLQKFLDGKGLSGRFLLPTPIALVDFADPHGQFDSVYAMERAKGVGLDRAIFLDSPSGYGGVNEVGQAVEFLSVFHVWNGHKLARAKHVQAAEREVAKSLEKLGQGGHRDGFLQRWRTIVPDQMPVAGKKDAHPENWLVDKSLRIIMIDLESVAQEIVFRDLAQLIDDYPVFTNDPAGWAQRLKLVDLYLAKSGIAYMPAEDREKAYTAFALQRIAFGFSFTRDKLRSTASSGGRQRLVERRKHYLGLARFIAVGARSDEARSLGNFLAQLA
jgi:tetratricopeptide (TPR) repeat protein